MSITTTQQEYLTLSVIAPRIILSKVMLNQILLQSKIRLKLKRFQETRFLYNILP